MAALRSISFMWAASFGAAGFALITQVLIARSVQPNDYGLYAASVTAAAILAPLAGLGIPGFFLKIFGEEGQQARRWVHGCLTAICYSLALGWISNLAYTLSIRSDSTGVFVGLALSPLILSFVGAEISMSRFQVEESHLGVSLWTVLPNLFRVLVACLGWLLKWPILWIATGIGCVSIIVGSLAAMTIIRARWDKVPKIQSPHGTEETGPIESALAAWPFGLSPFVFIVFFQGGVLILEANGFSKDAGIFSLALNILTAVYLIPTVVSQRFFLVRFHRWSVHDPERFLGAFRGCNGLALAFGGLSGILLALLAPFFIKLIFGDAYEDVGAVLVMCSIGVPARYLSCFVGAALSTKNNMKPRLQTQIVVAAIMLPIALYSIDDYGLLGAAFSTVLSEWILALAYLYGCVKHIFGYRALGNWTLKQSSLR